MTRPGEVCKLPAQSHVQVSFETPEHTANADALGTLRVVATRTACVPQTASS